MSINEKAVAWHYTVPHLEDSILGGLRDLDKDTDSLHPEDLAPVDEFHIRGRESTRELAGLTRIGPQDKVLDVGCGLGGSARYLAAEFGCHVTGLDLTRDYCRLAEEFSKRVGLTDKTVFHHGTALSLPFPKDTFDVAWTEHTQMNVQDKSKFYGEIARVLKPKGRLVFHDIFQGKGGKPLYPAPWAADASLSSLISTEEAKTLLELLGFEFLDWRDVTEPSLEWFHKISNQLKHNGPMPLGVHLLMGHGAAQKIENLGRNLEEDRITVLQAVLVH